MDIRRRYRLIYRNGDTNEVIGTRDIWTDRDPTVEHVEDLGPVPPSIILDMAHDPTRTMTAAALLSTFSPEERQQIDAIARDDKDVRDWIGQVGRKQLENENVQLGPDTEAVEALELLEQARAILPQRVRQLTTATWVGK